MKLLYLVIALIIISLFFIMTTKEGFDDYLDKLMLDRGYSLRRDSYETDYKDYKQSTYLKQQYCPDGSMKLEHQFGKCNMPLRDAFNYIKPPAQQNTFTPIGITVQSGTSKIAPWTPKGKAI